MADIFSKQISWQIHFLNFDFKNEKLKLDCLTVYLYNNNHKVREPFGEGCLKAGVPYLVG